ncbi:hypothetical protein ACCT09_03110, partial [Rhizobium ruizarguesonis]
VAPALSPIADILRGQISEAVGSCWSTAGSRLSALAERQLVGYFVRGIDVLPVPEYLQNRQQIAISAITGKCVCCRKVGPVVL